MRKWAWTLTCFLLWPPLCGGHAFAAAVPVVGGPEVRVGLAVGSPAAVVGAYWLGRVTQTAVVGPPSPPALTRWLAAQGGLAPHPVWTPAGSVVPGGAERGLVPSARGSPAAWRIGAAVPETGSAVQVGPFGGAYDGKPYRGTLVAKASADGVTVINTLPVEEYLRGVVPAEMPASWPLAALQAQTVAARTFTLKNLGRRSALGFDLYADTRDQAYGGKSVETPATDTAVSTTRGLVLTYDGQLIDAVYSANAGGQTASAEETWGTPVPYLRSSGLLEEPEDRWAVLLPVRPLLKAFPQLGGSLTGAGPGSVSSSGRVRVLVLRGDETVWAPLADVARAADLRGGIRSSRIFVVTPVRQRTWMGASAGPIRSFATWESGGPDQWTVIGAGPPTASAHDVAGVYLAGAGYGHGVGLSQWGAYALAGLGWNFERILTRFYPGARLAPAGSMPPACPTDCVS